MKKKIGKGSIVVSRTFNKRPEKDTEEHSEFEVGVFQTETASVSVPISITHNVGNYESVKTGVIVTVPCYVEEIEEAFVFAKEMAERKAEEMSDFSNAYKTFMKCWRRGDYA